MLDWVMGTGEGPLPRRLPTFRAQLQGEPANDTTAAPDVQFGQTAPPVARINPTNRELRFIVPLTVDTIYLGDLELAVSPQDVLSVDAARVLELLKPILLPAAYGRLAASADAKGRIDQAALGKEGIHLAYDAQRLALSLDIPVKVRQTRGLSLRDGQNAFAETLQPAGVSAYLNVRAAAELIEAGSQKGINPPVAELEGAVRIRGIVAESEGYLSARSNEPAFRRTGSRLVYEDQASKMRWTLGDTNFNARQFQASPTVMGLGVSRIYSQIDPQREIRASGAQSFSVLSSSVIETFVNGRSVERRTFQPGNYTLQDFPLANGANTVKLRIEDSSGAVRTIDFSVYANQSLVGKGVTEFSLFGGVYSSPTRSGIAYSRDWTAGGFLRTGLSEQVTAGINAQANRRTRQFGAEVVWGNPLGLIGFNLSASDTSHYGKGGAALVTYERQIGGQDTSRSTSIRASIEFRSKRFVIPDVAFGPSATELRASVGIATTLGENTYVAADAQYSRDRDRRGNAYGARLSGGFDLHPKLAFYGEAGFERGSSRRETYVRLGLRMRVGQRGTAQAEVDSKGRARANFSDSGGSGNGAWLASGDISRDGDAVSLNANGGLQANRADVGVQQTATWSTRGQGMTDARTTVRAAFAVAFADGAVALGRPVSEAFVIAGPHRSLAGKPVYLDPMDKSEAARSGSLGPALDGQISAHNQRTLIYQVPGAPSGYDLGAGNIAIKPPYRAGYHLVIGSDYHLLVIGRLLARDGSPVTLLAGKAIDLGNPKRPAMTVFTSRDGRFGAQGLRAGRWRIEMPTEPPAIYEFEVQEKADGIVRIDDLRPIEPKGRIP